VKNYVFISHSSEDKHLANAICHALEQAEVPCWIAPRDVPHGADWSAAIIDGIRESRLMVLVFSENANRSDYVYREVERASHHKCPILPIRLEDLIPATRLELFIGVSHWLDAMDGPSRKQLEQIAKAARAYMVDESDPSPIVPATPAPQPGNTSPPKPARTRSPGLRAAILLLMVILIIAGGYGIWRNAQRTAPDPAPQKVAKQETAVQKKQKPVSSGVTKPEAGSNKMTTVDLGDGVKLDLAWIPAGTFQMGSPVSEKRRAINETQHSVTLSRGFWVGINEVTQTQWEKVMGNNPSRFKGPNLPVEKVSWEDCQIFIQKLNAQAPGGGFRLPTEAEWEYACRAGTSGAYAGELVAVGWYESNSGSKTHDVAGKQPNPWGLYDMHGNAREWCEDWYGVFPSGTVTDPAGPGSGSSRVDRGGCWLRSGGYCRSADRFGDVPSRRNGGLGFRLARTAP
jgi:formylglycine-generating enzyme required for sulfatase activity